MRALKWCAWVLVLCLPALAGADPQDAGRSAVGFGSQGFVWSNMTPEQVAVMKLSGDAERGREAFRGCQGCHRRDASGRPDGTYPRLDGQHAVVVIKQVTDTRAGIRINPKMGPFAAEHAVSPQEIADIAVYVSALRSSSENGKGDAALVDEGARIYLQRGCVDCHGAAGQGHERKLYPVVAAQHYGYLLRELEHVQAGQRGNSHPEMVKSLRGATAVQLQALASFMSRLPQSGPAAAAR